MRNVLFVSHSAELNGAELWLLEILKGLDRRKYTPVLVVPRAGPLEEAVKNLGLETHVVPMKWWITEKSGIWRQPFAWIWNRNSVNRIADFIREKKIGLVFTNSAAMSCGAKAAVKRSVPHVWAIHEVLRGERPLLYYILGGRALVNFIVKSSTRVIVNSGIAKRAFPENERVILVYNGVEIKTGDEDRGKILRNELGLKNEDLIAGIVGKIYEGKGQRELIQAASFLSPKYPGFKVLVVGYVKDGRYYRRLRDFVRTGGLEERVLFTGYQRDLVNLLKIMNVVVVASVVDSFGRAALEAMAAGVPVLAVRAGGLPEIVHDGKNGFLVDSREPRKLADALDFIFQNPDKAKKAAEEGLRTVREKFSLERQIREVEHTLEDILKKQIID